MHVGYMDMMVHRDKGPLFLDMKKKKVKFIQNVETVTSVHEYLMEIKEEGSMKAQELKRSRDAFACRSELSAEEVHQAYENFGDEAIIRPGDSTPPPSSLPPSSHLPRTHTHHLHPAAL